MTINYFSISKENIDGFNRIKLDNIKQLRRDPFVLIIDDFNGFKNEYERYMDKITGVLILTNCNDFKGYFVGKNIFLMEFPDSLYKYIKKISEVAIGVFVMYKEQSKRNETLQLEFAKVKRDFSNAIEYASTIDRLIKDSFERKAHWESKALTKLVNFAVNKLKIIDLKKYPDEVADFLIDDFFGYDSINIYRYNKKSKKITRICYRGKKVKEKLSNPTLNTENNVIINNKNMKIITNLHDDIHIISINKKPSDSDFSDYDLSFISTFQTLISSFFLMKRTAYILQEKVIEISNIKASNDIISALKEEKTSLKKAIEELNISLLLKGVILATPIGENKYKIELQKGTQIRSWDKFMEFYQSNDKESHNWGLFYLIDSRYFIYGIIAFRLTREDNNICTIQQRVLDAIIPQIILVLSEKRSRKESITDQLTGLYNRRFIDEELKNKENIVNLNKRFKLSVIMMDIDNFKLVNDTYGHKTGDIVLVNTAKIIKDTLRDLDIVGRYGGEEFIALIHANLKTTVLICERIRKNIEDMKVKAGKDTLNITISIGISEFKSEKSFKEIVNIADQNLYIAKSKGKNIVIY